MNYDDFKKFINNEISNNRISHAYLIETGDISDAKPFIDYFVKALFHNGDANHDDKVDTLIDDASLADFKVLSPSSLSSSVNSSKIIDIDAIRNLITSFSNTSFSENKEVYVVTDASSFNAASSNALLKFLEEPSSNVVGILVCKNRYSVLDTLVSRCQIISLKNDEKFSISDNDLNTLTLLFSKDMGFFYYNDILESLPDKVSFNNFLLLSEKYFFNVIGGKIELDSSISNLKDYLYKVIILIEKYLKNNNYNVGYKLILDNFLTDVEEMV